MKVFLSMSFRGDLNVARRIYRLIEELGYKHTSDSLISKTPEQFYNWSNQKRLIHYRKVFRALKRTDLAVFECSTQSVTIGQLIQDCLYEGTPMLILVKKGVHLAFLDGLEEGKQKLLVSEYDETNLEKTIKNGLSYLEDFCETRFTLLLPPKIIHYLNQVGRESGNRSKYIRDLILKGEGEMKVFFIGSPRFNWENQKFIYDVLKRMGYQHTSHFADQVNPESFYKVDSKEWESRYVARLNEMRKADFCVFEASTPSHAIGQLVQEAIREEKPAIALHTNDYHPRFMEGSSGSENRLQVVEYTLDDVSTVLSDAIEVVKELLTRRFTMLMPSKLMDYLDRVARDTKFNRSEYIRNLLEKEMSENRR